MHSTSPLNNSQLTGIRASKTGSYDTATAIRLLDRQSGKKEPDMKKVATGVAASVCGDIFRKSSFVEGVKQVLSFYDKVVTALEKSQGSGKEKLITLFTEQILHQLDRQMAARSHSPLFIKAVATYLADVREDHAVRLLEKSTDTHALRMLPAVFIATQVEDMSGKIETRSVSSAAANPDEESRYMTFMLDKFCEPDPKETVDRDTFLTIYTQWRATASPEAVVQFMQSCHDVAEREISEDAQASKLPKLAQMRQQKMAETGNLLPKRAQALYIIHQYEKGLQSITGGTRALSSQMKIEHSGGRPSAHDKIRVMHENEFRRNLNIVSSPMVSALETRLDSAIRETVFRNKPQLAKISKYYQTMNAYLSRRESPNELLTACRNTGSADSSLSPRERYENGLKKAAEYLADVKKELAAERNATKLEHVHTIIDELTKRMSSLEKKVTEMTVFLDTPLFREASEGYKAIAEAKKIPESTNLLSEDRQSLLTAYKTLTKTLVSLKEDSRPLTPEQKAFRETVMKELSAASETIEKRLQTQKSTVAITKSTQDFLSKMEAFVGRYEAASDTGKAALSRQVKEAYDSALELYHGLQNHGKNNPGLDNVPFFHTLMTDMNTMVKTLFVRLDHAAIRADGVKETLESSLEALSEELKIPFGEFPDLDVVDALTPEPKLPSPGRAVYEDTLDHLRLLCRLDTQVGKAILMGKLQGQMSPKERDHLRTKLEDISKTDPYYFTNLVMKTLGGLKERTLLYTRLPVEFRKAWEDSSKPKERSISVGDEVVMKNKLSKLFAGGKRFTDTNFHELFAAKRTEVVEARKSGDIQAELTRDEFRDILIAMVRDKRMPENARMHFISTISSTLRLDFSKEFLISFLTNLAGNNKDKKIFQKLLDTLVPPEAAAQSGAKKSLADSISAISSESPRSIQDALMIKAKKSQSKYEAAVRNVASQIKALRMQQLGGISEIEWVDPEFRKTGSGGVNKLTGSQYDRFIRSLDSFCYIVAGDILANGKNVALRFEFWTDVAAACADALDFADAFAIYQALNLSAVSHATQDVILSPATHMNQVKLEALFDFSVNRKALRDAQTDALEKHPGTVIPDLSLFSAAAEKINEEVPNTLDSGRVNPDKLILYHKVLSQARPGLQDRERAPVFEDLEALVFSQHVPSIQELTKRLREIKPKL